MCVCAEVGQVCVGTLVLVNWNPGAVIICHW